jgi:hypothetical protein
MLPLKAFVNALQNAVWDSDGLIWALPFFDGALKHCYSWLVLEHPPDRLDVEAPERRDVGRGVVLFGRNGSFHREARMCEFV